MINALKRIMFGTMMPTDAELYMLAQLLAIGVDDATRAALAGLAASGADPNMIYECAKIVATRRITREDLNAMRGNGFELPQAEYTTTHTADGVVQVRKEWR